MTLMTYFTTLLYFYSFKEPFVLKESCAPGLLRQTFAAGLHIGRRQISSFGSLLHGQGFWGAAVYMRNDHKRPGSCRAGYGLFRRQCARSDASIKTHNAPR